MSDTEKKPQHIISLKAENVKRLSAVEITPKGDVVVIGGQNGAGKSSVLDSIIYAMGGKDAICDQPIRRGEEKASIVLETEELTVERTFTEKGSYLTVKNKDGFAAGSPQALLDKMFNGFSFDPLEFTRMDAKKQRETFMRLLKLDFSALDKEYATVFEERTFIGRDGKALKAQFDGIPADPEAPTTEVVVSEIVKQLEEAQAVNRDNELKRSAASKLQADLARQEQWIADYEAKLAEMRQNLAKIQSEAKVATEAADACKDIDTEPLSAKIRDAEQINSRARQAKQRASLKDQLDQVLAEWKKRDSRLTEINATKATMIKEADFPIKELTFSSDGVLVNDLPFDQASSAEQLRIAVAMGLSANPQFRVVLIRDGSLLDENSMAAIAEMAKQYDASVWIERVGDGKEVSIVIEDGHVKEDRTKESTDAPSN